MKVYYRIFDLQTETTCYVLETQEGIGQKIDTVPWKDHNLLDEYIGLDRSIILAPVQPSKIIAVGVNYRDHAMEMNHPLPEEPVLFLKSPTSLTGPDTSIILPKASQQVEYEAELCLFIGKEGFQIKEEDALSYIGGYSCLNDVTARDLQKKDGQWARAKSFSTFCPVGPAYVTDIDAGNLDIELKLNGEIRQSSNTSNLIFSLPRLISYISEVMVLHPQDIITTGTTSGVGPMKPGDTVEVSIQQIGTLRNHVQ